MNAKIIYKNEITFRAGKALLEGNLVIPEQAKGVVIFCHGINSSRHSPRNRHLADVFNNHGIATLLVSLEKVEEDLFLKGTNLNELADRVCDITQAILNINPTRKLPIGYFGSGSGAAVALTASTRLQGFVSAIVCRDGRPDAAVEILDQVKTPSLFLCAEKDKEGIAINEMAKGYIRGTCRLQVIKEASYLFEEEGKLDEVAQYAIDWFNKYLPMPKQTARPLHPPFSHSLAS